jgi:hypothetical protein
MKPAGARFSAAPALALTLFCAQMFSAAADAQTYGVDPAADDKINFDSFAKAVAARRVESLDEALALVPPRFFTNHVLVYRSRSLQDSSYLYPRAIVFGESGKFLLAFNGHEKHRGYNQLELIQFRDRTNSWEFREMTFAKGKAPEISAPNPKKCLECHQSPRRANVDPRPNWEPYNFWPGAFGSVDDEIRPVLKEGLEKHQKGDQTYLPSPMERFLKQDMFLVAEQSREQEMLGRYESEIRPNHPRYRFLPAYSTRSPLSLAKILAIHNFRRVVRIARAELGPMYGVYKFALAGMQMNYYDNPAFHCGGLYLPDSVRVAHLGRLKATRPIEEAEYSNRDYGDRRGPSLERSLDLVFEPLGISTRDWSMDFKTGGRFSFDKDRYQSPHDSGSHLRKAIEIVDPVLAKLNCDQLKTQSLAALERFEKGGGLQKVLDRAAMRPVAESQPKPLLSRCISCHVESTKDSVPKIPFDRPEALKPLLKQGKYARGNLLEEIRFRMSDHAPNQVQMPPSGVFEGAERDALMKAFEGLAGE